MEAESHHGNSSDGGGGPSDAPRDPERTPPPGPDGPADPVLSLDQIRTTGSSNEYTEGPTAASRPPTVVPRPGQRKSEPGDEPGVPGAASSESQGPRLNQRILTPQSQRHATANSAAARDAPPRPPAGEDPGGGGPGTGHGPAAGERIIESQPKRAELKQEELKPLTAAERPAEKHALRCRDCGRCVCADCARPRPLPSCWTCGRRCVCSAHSAVEYASCACCVKGLFYHCSSDDEDTCADKPFSCSQPRRCARWSAVGLLALLLPCLLCYLPARGCLAACQSCYDLATRPGCRCKNADCKCPGPWGDA